MVVRATIFNRLKLLLILSALIAECAVLQGAVMAAPVSIKRSEHLSVDGAKLYLQIRGADRTAPVLTGSMEVRAGLSGLCSATLTATWRSVLWWSIGISAVPGVHSIPRRIHTASPSPSISPTSTPWWTILDRVWARTRSS